MTTTAPPSACDRPGCGGSILDGYCDTCGLAPSRSASGGERASARVDVERLTGRTAASGRTSRRSRVGAGVVDIEPIHQVDPATVVMADPSVPENRRFCTRCDNPVGRGDANRKGRQAGFCPSCGARFDFAAKLHTGDLVANQYEVAGALAHGGLGWIYLVRDRNVSDRWCVLKGLLDAADPAAAEAAVAERQFLAQVQHPVIVDIYNFVNHGGQGYIVMEYVGGPSIKQRVTRRRREGGGPMPVTEAAAYLLAAMPAFGYLHQHGLVYCDFKPDNVIHVGDAVQLIDLGGVRRLDDPESAIFGTVGYQAPEVPKTGPTVASDLYTIGRALAVLILDWPEWQGADREQLPAREEHQVLVDHDCLWRFLQRACAPDPEQRFTDADEMAEALHGVLCQVAAATDGLPRPYTSTRWSPPRPKLDGLDWRALPNPMLPNHPQLPNRVAGIADGDPQAAIQLAASGGELSWADQAAVARAYCEIGDFHHAYERVDSLVATDGDTTGSQTFIDAARTYLHGIVATAASDPARAEAHFDRAYTAAPGEAACALAYAAALEGTGDPTRLEEAAALYQQVVVTDPTWVSAVAGLSRVLLALNRPVDAARVLTAVPPTHLSRAEALTLACRAMQQGGFDERVAAAATERLRAAQGDRSAAEAELAVALYGAALTAVLRREAVGSTVGDRPASASELARAAEDALLDLADATPNVTRRHQLLDRAARTRPWSLW
ncbi:MAG: protein kinase domain-containing protein [Acidimicrobiales bacterium]